MPGAGRELARGLSQDQAVVPARNVVAFHRENGRGPERLGATLGRVGFDAFRQTVL